MGGGFQFFDILIFAVVAVFLIIKLGSVLGKRTGHQDRPNASFDGTANRDRQREEEGKVVQLPTNEHMKDDTPDVDEPLYQGRAGDGLIQIRIADPTFSPTEFLEGARAAFEMILNAYVAGDRSALKNLLSKEVFENFQNAIREREKAEQRMEDTLVGIDEAEIEEAFMDGNFAHVTVRYVSEQVNVLYDRDGKVVEGDPNKVVKVIDLWTYRRDVRSGDPNWELTATRSG